MKKLLIIFSLLLCTVSLIATDVYGNQSGTWALADSPFNVVGDVTVLTGFSLEIEAGVEVIAMGDFRITALGNILAEGTEADSIRFHGYAGYYWGGIRLENEELESIFDYCRISNTDDANDYGVHSVNSPVQIDHSFLDDHQKGISFSGLSSDDPSYMEIKNSRVADVQKSGITVVDNSNVLIDNCEITRCGLGASFYGAIQLSLQSNSHSCSPTITNNLIHHNDKQGLTLANLFGYDNMAPTVMYNEVAYNYTGIYLYVGKGYFEWNDIHHNFEENNADSGAGVMLYGDGADATFTYNSIHHNYTGFYLTNDATVNLGDLNNTNTEDDGYNCIYDNIFFDGTEYSVYNTSAVDVTAENTVWDDDPGIDISIIDGNDNAAYGIVDYEPTLSPFAPPDSLVIDDQYNCYPLGFVYPSYLEPTGWNLYIDSAHIGLFAIDEMYSLLDAGMVQGQNYEIFLSYVYDGGESVFVETSYFYNPIFLNPPQNPEIEPMGLMSWEEPEPGSSSPFQYYNVYKDSVLVGDTTDLFWQYEDITIGVQYLMEVSAVYDEGESNLVAAYWIPAIHNPPTNLSFEFLSDHVQLTWEPPVGSNIEMMEYHLFINGNLCYVTSDLTYNIYGLTNGESYLIGVAALYLDGITSDPAEETIIVTESGDILNLETKLLGNYPNPFNPTTTISFSLNAEDAQNAKLIIYNLRGQTVRRYSIFNNQSSIIWDGTDQVGKTVSSGMYFYKLTAGEKQFTMKMLLMK
jgi:Right handed beta helix region/Secretion system C-terminal sorting domain